MATIKVEPTSIDELKSAIRFSSEQTSQAAELVAKAVNGISGMSFSAKYGLDSDLTSLKNRLNKQALLILTCGKTVEEAVNAFVEVDNSATASAKAAWSDPVLRLYAAVGAVAAGLSLATKDKLDKQSGINDTFTGGGSGSAYQNQLPDWALEYDENDLEIINYFNADGDGPFKHRICTHNLPDQNGVQAVSCTYYTLRKLRDKGLGFPFQLNNTSDGNWNGGQWYENSIGVEKAAGSTSIQQLLDTFGGKDKSLENVVVSFSGTSLGSHVLLLDKVFVDFNGVTQVSYSDNTNWIEGGVLTDVNKTTPIVQESLDDFIKRYTIDNSIFGNIIGSVLIGRGET